jgi:hypothetical protein
MSHARVIPATAGIHCIACHRWIPACAGMTGRTA